MNIEEDYCSYETSKCLQEHGFDLQESCNCGGFPECICEVVRNPEKYVYRPTHSLALKWLRLNHNLQVSVGNVRNKSDEWDYSIISIVLSPKSNIHFESKIVFPTHEDATEDAILKSLTLIK